MAVAVIGGLIVSTVLSLLVVPAFYVVADGAKVRIGAWRRRHSEARRPQLSEPEGGIG